MLSKYAKYECPCSILCATVEIWGFVWKKKPVIFSRCLDTVFFWTIPTIFNQLFNCVPLNPFKPDLHALKNRHGTAHFRHRADYFWARHSTFLACKRSGPTGLNNVCECARCHHNKFKFRRERDVRFFRVRLTNQQVRSSGFACAPKNNRMDVNKIQNTA